MTDTGKEVTPVETSVKMPKIKETKKQGVKVKNLYDVLNEVTEAVEDKPTIYCDMDMVLCDFLKGAEEVLGVPFPKSRKRN